MYEWWLEYDDTGTFWKSLLLFCFTASFMPLTIQLVMACHQYCMHKHWKYFDTWFVSTNFALKQTIPSYFWHTCLSDPNWPCAYDNPGNRHWTSNNFRFRFRCMALYIMFFFLLVFIYQFLQRNIVKNESKVIARILSFFRVVMGWWRKHIHKV